MCAVCGIAVNRHPHHVTGIAIERRIGIVSDSKASIGTARGFVAAPRWTPFLFLKMSRQSPVRNERWGGKSDKKKTK
jgi:hypothetical protein